MGRTSLRPRARGGPRCADRESAHERTGITGFVVLPRPVAAGPGHRSGPWSGGMLTQALIEKLFLPAFGNPILSALEDQAARRSSPKTRAARIAFTTDSFVVKPIFFPGGDIGSLAVHGTINDLAVGGRFRDGSAPPSFSRRDYRSTICAGSAPRCRPHARGQASCLWPATRKWSIAARAIKSTSRRRASACCPRGRMLSCGEMRGLGIGCWYRA